MPNVLDEIRRNPKPGDVANWWGRQSPASMAQPLDAEESAYLEFFTSSEVDPVLRVGRGIANSSNLSPEDLERAGRRFGAGRTAVAQFVNYENRRRIVAHYVLTHPATLQYQLQLYRFSRDALPPFFVAERVYELFTGREAFTGERVSRVGAGGELLLAVVVVGVLRLARPVGPARPSTTRSLTDPIYDLPPEGGGMNINGRWYTEHALERMAPDTPQVRAELRGRAVGRLKRIGLNPGSPAWEPCLNRALQKIDPRGIPPSVVEAEIARPGSTTVRVITARQGQVVVTVMPK